MNKKPEYEVLAMDWAGAEELRSSDMEVLKDVAARLTNNDHPILVMRRNKTGDIELMYFYNNEKKEG